MSDRGRTRAREGAATRGLSEPVWKSLIGDWNTDEEEDDGDLEDLHGDESNWVDDEGEDEPNNDNEPSGPRILNIQDPPYSGGNVGEEAVAAHAPRRGRRTPFGIRSIKSLEDAMKPENYDKMSQPSEADRREVTAVLVPRDKKKNIPQEDITFKNWKRTNRGQKPR